MKVKRLNVILLPWESYSYLRQKMCYDRLGKFRTESQMERLKLDFEKCSNDGFKKIMDGDMGGSNKGKWTSWSCDDMKVILDEVNLTYLDGGKAEVIKL